MREFSWQLGDSRVMVTHIMTDTLYAHVKEFTGKNAHVEMSLG